MPARVAGGLLRKLRRLRELSAQELGARASDWELLLQLDASDEAGMKWGDCGGLYYWIRRQDLAAARFDQSWFVFQSH